jgi:hypothetical protein
MKAKTYLSHTCKFRKMETEDINLTSLFNDEWLQEKFSSKELCGRTFIKHSLTLYI